MGIPNSRTHTPTHSFSLSLSSLVSGAVINEVIKDGSAPLSFRAWEMKAEELSGRWGGLRGREQDRCPSVPLPRADQNVFPLQ